MKFYSRSYQPELLDGDNIPFEEIERNMLELNTINHWLGGHHISRLGFLRLAGDRDRIHICEIGCGGGDNLAALSRESKRRNIQLQLTGIDQNPDCIRVASGRFADTPVNWIASDYRKLGLLKPKPDILFSSLFCHHFTDEELVQQLRWMSDNAGVGFFINDLHRSPLAYYAIRLLTRLFSRSRLVKHDAPLSVRRGFRRNEWEKILTAAGIRNYSIEWRWAFRWLIVANNQA